ncbi:MAG: InlB B-repeat-containing protein, partial [Candidatus Scatovivens sp.]
MKGKLTTKTIVISVLIVLLLAVAVTASVIFLKDSGEASATEEQTTSTAGNAVSEEKNANITDDGENITTEEQKQTPEQNNTENAQNNVNNVNNNGNQVNGAVVGVLPEQQPAPTTIEQERVVSEETKLNWNNSGITGASTSVDSDELYIYYNNLEYKVEYIYEDIEETVIEIFEGNEKGKIIESYEDKAITGYELDKVENLPLEVTENQEKNVIKVYYAKKEYTATFKLNNGEEDIEITQKYGTDLEAPEEPTKEGHTFKGWDKELPSTMPDEDTVYEAQWEINKYTVTWKNYNGEVLETDENVEYGTTPEYNGETPTRAADTQYTYTFSGWDEEIKPVTGNVTYTAKYTETTRKYTVTFVDEDETTILKEATEYAYGTKAEEIVKPADPTKASTAEYTYTFSGWTPAIVDVTGNAVYTATYRATTNKYTVTFVDEDGITILKEATEYAYGTEAVNIGKPKNPTKAADDQYTYTFSGWTPAIADVTGNAVYTATYRATTRNYTVTFVDEDGTTVLKEATEYAYGTKAEEIVKPAEPTKEATAEYTYAFAGWTPTIADVTGNAVYTATYRATTRNYTVTFVDEDETTVLKEATEYAYGTKAEDIVKPAEPTKASTKQYTYTFSGWTPTIVDVTGNAVYTATYDKTV